MDFTKYLDKALELGTKAVNEHGQQAWEMTLWIVRVDALTFIIPAVLVLIVGVSYQLWYWRTNVPAMTQQCETLSKGRGSIYSVDMSDLPQFWMTGIPLIVSFASIFAAVVTLSSVWLWVSLFKPELYLAKMALEKVL